MVIYLFTFVEWVVLPHIGATQNSDAICYSLYLMNLLKGMDTFNFTPVTIFEDNQGAIVLSRNTVTHQRCKHIDISYHFVRSIVSDGVFLLNL